MSKIFFEMQPLQNPSLCGSTALTLPTGASFAQLSSANTQTQPEYDNFEFVPTNGLLSGLYLPSYHSLYFRRTCMIIFLPILTNRTVEQFL
jgi:hypothetical protein